MKILSKVREKAGDKELYAHQLFSTLMELSKASQAELLIGNSEITGKVENMLKTEEAVFPKTGMVACQGVEGAYSGIACEKLFKRPSILFFSTFESVFSAVEKGLCRYGVIPVENSTVGCEQSAKLTLEHSGELGYAEGEIQGRERTA